MSAANLIVQVAPMGQIASVVQQEQTAALMQQHAQLQAAAASLLKKNQQVEKSDHSENGQKVRAKKERQQEKQREARQDARKGDAEEKPDYTTTNVFAGIMAADPEADAASTSPRAWSGKLLNMKV